MNARTANINDIFNTDTEIAVPFFQRAYVWKEDQWSQFLTDIELIDEMNCPHFFGALIFQEQASEEDVASKHYEVVDGQQRLTTLTIFMKALCLCKGQLPMFETKFMLMDESVALRLGRNDHADFEKVMAQEQLTEIAEGSKSNIICAYQYFLKHIGEVNFSNKVIQRILKNVQFVLIELKETEDAQQIFDTINSLGVRLTTAELLKNYLFNQDTIDDFEEKWESVFEPPEDEEVRDYWKQEIDTGRYKRAIIDIFLDAYFEILVNDGTYSVTSADKKIYRKVEGLARSYQNFIRKYCHGDKSAVIDGLRQYARCFYDTFWPGYCQSSVPREASVERLSVIIFGLDNTTFIPYVLYITYNVEDKNELKRMYHLLESYIMRRIVHRDSPKNYNKLVESLIHGHVLDYESLKQVLLERQDTSMIVPDDEDLEEAFQESNLANKQAKGVLYLIESGYRSEKSATDLLGFNEYTLEHLMPKKWRNHWPSCKTEEEANERDKRLLKLGNLAIITQKLNTAIRDDDWQSKKQGRGRKNGLNICAAGLITCQDALRCEKWTEKEIRKRGESLFEMAAEVWKIK